MSDPQEEFTAMWHAEAPRVLAFARRHVGDEAAQDVVAETFTVAWRRRQELPDPPIGWLLVTARRVMSNRHRATRRHRALEERIALLDGVAAYVADSAETALTRREALERLARLDERHREALLLVSWDGLSNEQAAAVLDIKPATFRRRVSRARQALTASRSVDTEGTEPRLAELQELT